MPQCNAATAVRLPRRCTVACQARTPASGGGRCDATVQRCNGGTTATPLHCCVPGSDSRLRRGPLRCHSATLQRCNGGYDCHAVALLRARLGLPPPAGAVAMPQCNTATLQRRYDCHAVALLRPRLGLPPPAGAVAMPTVQRCQRPGTGTLPTTLQRLRVSLHRYGYLPWHRNGA